MDDANMGELRPIVTREEARATGLSRYFTGEACPHGHVAERMTSSCGCIVCMKIRKRAHDKGPGRESCNNRSRAYRKENAEKLREYFARRRAENRESELARSRAYYAANKDRAAEYGRRYRAENIESIRLRYRQRMSAFGDECRAKGRAYYHANKERILESRRRYRESNIERCRERSRVYHRNNREELSRKSAEWRRNNKEECDARRTKWQISNPHKWRAIKNEAQRRRSLRVSMACPAWVNRADNLEIYEEAARITKETGVKHHVDHIIPIQHPDVCGLHVPWNLQIITASENSRKSNKLLCD